MSKVSYDEAKKAFREICSGYEEPNSREIVGNFIAQHRPPSFDEVVKAWEDALGECEVTQNKDEIKVLMPNLKKYLIKKDHVYSDRTVYSMNTEILNAINLTIRYLESQKEEIK